MSDSPDWIEQIVRERTAALRARVAKLEEANLDLEARLGTAIHQLNYWRSEFNNAGARMAKLEKELEEKTGEAQRQYDYNVSQIVRVAKLEEELRAEQAKKPSACE